MGPFCTLWQMVELEKGYCQVRWDASGAAVISPQCGGIFFSHVYVQHLNAHHPNSCHDSRVAGVLDD